MMIQVVERWDSAASTYLTSRLSVGLSVEERYTDFKGGGVMKVVSTEINDDKVILVVQAAVGKLRFSISRDDARRLHRFRLRGGEFETIYTSSALSER